jgi:hypothetical protein
VANGSLSNTPAPLARPMEVQMLPTYAEFEQAALAQGYDEVLVREWAQLRVVPTDTHPFAANAVVVAGEKWLTEGEHTRHLRCGDTFTLARDVPHAEHSREAGATYWVARRR